MTLERQGHEDSRCHLPGCGRPSIDRYSSILKNVVVVVVLMNCAIGACKVFFYASEDTAGFNLSWSGSS